jgi:hypothetical protein
MVRAIRYDRFPIAAIIIDHLHIHVVDGHEDHVDATVAETQQRQAKVEGAVRLHFFEPVDQ